jgi:hypothetical protein
VIDHSNDDMPELRFYEDGLCVNIKTRMALREAQNGIRASLRFGTDYQLEDLKQPKVFFEQLKVEKLRADVVQAEKLRVAKLQAEQLQAGKPQADKAA